MDGNDLVHGFSNDKDENLKISLEKIDAFPNGLRLNLSGYIDTYNSSFFQRKVQSVVDAGFSDLIFDCSSLDYLSSTGVGALIAFLKMVKFKGGDIVLFGVKPGVREVLQLLGFSQFFSIRETAADALSFFKKDAPISEGVFPKIISCPVCAKRLKATRAGRFRCSECKSILSVDQQGTVALG